MAPRTSLFLDAPDRGGVTRRQGLVARARAEATIRRHFEDTDALEVHTPTFGTCPGLDAHVHALGPLLVEDGDLYPMTSPEFFMKRLLVGGAGDIFQLARAFRSEELGRHHEPEFTLLEWYRLGVSSEDLMAETEALVRAVAGAIAGDGATLRVRRGDEVLAVDLQGPFLRLTVSEAFERYADCAIVHDLAEQNPDEFFQLYVDLVEPALARLSTPVFLTHFPRSQAALARLHADGQTAERFELVVGGVELCNGYAELTNAAEQRARFELEQERREEAGDPVYPLDEAFLAALEEGLPECSGNALGLDRLVQLALGADKIETVLAFPAALAAGASTVHEP